jgi:outer membrane protein assembly factor BamB/N-acetylneuraminic acid mutarotase
MKRRSSPTITAQVIRGSFYLLLVVAATLLAFFPLKAPAKSERRALTFAQRVAYQRAMEEVYWQHRIWPQANAVPKPSLEKVMSQTQIEKKVEDYLRNSQALEDYWQRPITPDQLQAEMERIASHTKQPGVLRELFEAVGNDPHVIAECLARPALSERLLTNFYAHDQRFHGELKQRAEADLQTHHTVQQMRQLSGNYSEIEVVRSDSAGEQENDGAEHGLRLNSHDWDKEVQKLAAMFSDTATGRARPPGAPPTQINTGVLSPLQEDEERYYALAILNKSHGRFKLATVEWRKEPLSSWRAKAEDQVPKGMAAVTTNYTLPTISADPTVCTDTWTATSGPPSPRCYHTAVWTGTEMIIWGGTVMNNNYFNTGERYNPSTDNWVATSITNAPSGRSGHTAVWTGSEMVVWGGNLLNTGGKYNPATDTWAATSVTNAPGGREGHTAVWSGSEMIIWGGYNSLNDLNTGGRYNPGTNSWTATNVTNAPSARASHTAIWGGNVMIIWGGYDGNNYFNTGGRYNPVTNSWISTGTINAPARRQLHTAVWTGSEMITWGGNTGYGTDLNTGGRYNPGTNSWIATRVANAPTARDSHSAVWTGSEMIVWGGATSGPSLNTGGRYNPATDSWTATAITNAPDVRYIHTAVWTGSEMIVWGGFGHGYLNTGGRYNPATDNWMPTGGSDARSSHTAVWTGSEMIIWGGIGYSNVLNSGGRYNPSMDTWAATGTTNAPDGRYDHTAVWTGSEMIVWGGAVYSGGNLNTGGRYNPATDRWAVTSTSNAPSARDSHTAVWTGNEMIIWGGNAGSNIFNTGGRYSPAADSWIATTTTNAPTGRTAHTAVWTSSEMIVWGGEANGNGNTGGRYNPSTNTWRATSTTNAPDGRYDHTAVWTGSEMIVWGGEVNSGVLVNTGGTYNPNTNSWRATSRTNAPDGRYDHTAVWTGSEMIIWGGNATNNNYLNTGARYNPITNNWVATSTTNAPSGRSAHTAVWTGSEMIVWGGEFGASPLDTGGRYCAHSGPSPTPTPTAAPTPAVTTDPANNVASFSATLNGSLNPRGSTTTVYFQYGLTTSYGSNTSMQTQTGNTIRAVSATIGGLSATTTYHFRSVAHNAGGTAYGNDSTFTTLSTMGLPVVTTNPATNVSNSSATLNGSLDPHGLTTSVHFQYGTTTNYGFTAAVQTQSGNTFRNVSANISGLTASTTYHFRIVATNSAGTTVGGDRTFITLSSTEPPVVITRPATNVASFSATLNGSLNPRGSTTSVSFQYGLTTSYGHTTPMQTQNGNAVLAINANISGLTASHTYHFRIVAHNGGGTVFGSDGTFTTLTATGPPTVTTNPATNIGSLSAMLNASVNPHGLATTVYFQYGTTTSYGLTTPMQSKTGYTYQNVTARISGLAASSTYHFRIVATNSAGTVFGSDTSFTTFRKDESVAFQNNVVHDGSDPASPLVPPLTMKWRRNFSATGVSLISYPLIAQGRVFVTTSTGYTSHVQKLMALDAVTGATIWSANVNSDYPFANAAYDSGKVFVVNYHGTVKAFDAATGAMLWSIVLPGGGVFTSPPTAVNGIVYTGGTAISPVFDGIVYAVNETNGALLWTMGVLYGGDHSSPAVSQGKVFVSYADADSYAFNAVTGQQVWSYLTCGSGSGGTNPVVHAGQIYVRNYLCTPGIIGLVLNANTGSLIRTFNSDTPPAFFGNLALFLQNGTLVAVENGQQVWSFAGDGGLQSAPVVVNHTIYIGSSSGVLYGLNGSGQQIWSTQVGAPIPYPDEHNPVIATGLGAGDGLLIVPTASTLVAYGN